MGLQQEDAVLNVKINGDPAAASIKEMTGQIKYLTTAIEAMHKADNPQLYASRVAQLQALKAARDAERASINQTTEAVNRQSKDFASSLASIKSGLETLGIGVSIGLLVSWGKELLNIEIKASGIERAFARIGNTAGLIDKLREASRGMITDLDLDRLAVKANNANVPLAKMPELLAFAAQRARDTGQDVTELTDKLISGLGRGGTRSLAVLGISTREVKDEFKKTGDMVEAVSNIIKRRMAESADDVDNFGDRMTKKAITWSNIWNSVAKGFSKVTSRFMNPMGGDDGPSQEDIEKATNAEVKRFGDLEKIKDEDLTKAMAAQKARIAKLAIDGHNYEKALQRSLHEEDDRDKRVRLNEDIRKTQVSLIAARNAMSAIANQQAQRVQREEETGQKGTVEWIDKQISALQSEQNQLSKTSAEWKNYADQIKKLQERRDAITGGKKDKKGESDRERALKEFQRLAIEQRQFEAADIASLMAKNDKEVELEKEKYDKFIQKEKDFLTMKGTTAKQRESTTNNIAKLESEKAQAVTELRIKQEKELTEKINQFREQMGDKLATELQKEQDQINKFYDGLKKDAGTDQQQLDEIELARERELTDAKLREKKRFEEEALKIEEVSETDPAKKAQIEIIRINKKYDDEIAALKKKYSKELQATKEFQQLLAAIQRQRQGELNKQDETIAKAAKDAAINAAQDVANATFQIAANNRHAELDAHINQLENERDSELSNANLTQSQKDSINQKYAKQEADLKKQAWEADKKASIEQALINGALAVTKALASAVPPFNFIEAAAVAVATGAQIAVIENQPTPQFATGGFLPDGPSHAQGGINLVGPYGRILGNVEGGEPILSRKTYANNRGVVHALMAAKGGPVDYDRINQATTSREMRRSAPVQSPGASGSGGKVTQGGQVDISELVDEMRLTRIAIQEKQLSINRRAWDIETNKVDDIRSNANA